MASRTISQEETSPATGQLLLETLEKRWRKYLEELERCRAEFSNEAVHDVRVALRRLLALIRLLNSIAPRPRLRKLGRALKRQLDAFDDLRDTQVMLAEIAGTLRNLPGLAEFQSHLERVERRLLKDLRKKIGNLDLKEISRRIWKTHEALAGEENADSAAPILQSVDDAFLVVRQRYERIDPAQPATIHRVRVAFKSFRYMIEIAHPLLKDFPLDNLKRMHDYQSMMGDVQDAEIFLKNLADFDASSSAAEPVRSHYELRRADAVSAYLKDKDMLQDFWRPSPEETFPWEKTE